jgi:hypothetical protein
MKKNELKKVDYYTVGVTDIEVYFPENRVCCQWCKFCKSDHGLNRCRCLLTDELLVYVFEGRGNRCPLMMLDNYGNVIEEKE